MGEVENRSVNADALTSSADVGPPSAASWPPEPSPPPAVATNPAPAINDAAAVAVSGGAATATANEPLPAAALAQLNTRFDELGQLLSEINRLSAERERIIDRLHQENQQLRSGELEQALLPLCRDLIRLHDELRQTAARYADQEAATSADASRDFQAYSEAAADILYRYGIERYDAEPGMPFNPKEHRALRAVPTADPELGRTIAKVVRAGFRSATRTVRFLEAEVYSLTVQPPQAAAVQLEEESAPSNH